MATKVVKIRHDNLYTNLYIGDFDNEVVMSIYPRKDFPLGKVSLSIKIGKRRRLVKGIVRHEHHSSQHIMGLMDRYYFKPNDMKRLRTFIRLAEEKHAQRK